MTRSKRLRLAVVGLLVLVSFLLKEIFLPERTGTWHDVGIVLYAIGSVVLIIYLLIAVKSKNE